MVAGVLRKPEADTTHNAGLIVSELVYLLVAAEKAEYFAFRTELGTDEGR